MLVAFDHLVRTSHVDERQHDRDLWGDLLGVQTRRELGQPLRDGVAFDECGADPFLFSSALSSSDRGSEAATSCTRYLKAAAPASATA
jgi:hypothetical protein